MHRAEIEIRSSRFPPSVFKAPYLFSNRCLTVDRQRTVSMISGPLYHVFSFPLKEEAQFPLIAFKRSSFCQIVFSWVCLCWFLFPAFFSQSPMEFPIPCFLPKKRAVDSINLLLWIGLFLLFCEKVRFPNLSFPVMLILLCNASKTFPFGYRLFFSGSILKHPIGSVLWPAIWQRQTQSPDDLTWQGFMP